MVDERGLRRDLPLQHAEEVDPPGERVGDRLERERGGRRALDLEGCATLRGRGHALDEQVEQRVRPEVLGRDRARDGEDLAARDAELERGGDVVRIELLALEVALHQRLVDLHHLVEQLLAVLLRELDHRFGDRDGVGLLLPVGDRVRAHVEDVDDSGQLVLRADRDVHGDALRGELVLDLAQRAEEVGALTVEHVHDEHAREAQLLGELLHAGRPHLEPHHAGDDDQCSLDDAERAARLTLEGRVTGTVDEVDLPPLPLGVGERQRDRELALLLVLVRVRDGRAGLDRPEAVDLAGLEEERLDEGRLARPAVTDDSDVADLPGLGCSHLRAFLLVPWVPENRSPRASARSRQPPATEDRLDILRTRLD